MKNKREIIYDDIGKVVFQKNRRSKSVKIKVKPDLKIAVSLPTYYSFKQAERLLLKNKEWVITRLQTITTHSRKIDINSTISTKLHNIYIKSSEKKHYEVKDNNVYIFIYNADNQEYISNIVTEVYRYEAKQTLPRRLKQLAQQHGFSYNKVSIRNNKSNWGSCSSANNISLNLQMMKLPDELIDYILLHELVHTEIKNHSNAFWKRLDEITNFRAKNLSKAVRQYSTYTLL